MGQEEIFMETAFAPAERASDETIQRQFELIKKLPFVWDFLDAIPTISMVLNAERQMVFANRAFRIFRGIENAESMACDHAAYCGKRPGEALGCIHESLTAGGCGTSVFCRTCGAAQSIMNSQKDLRLDVQECRLICGEANEPLDLRVWARPMMIAEEPFTVFSIMDISDEKRRAALERIFFHDVLNAAGNVKGLADMLGEARFPNGEMGELAGMLAESAEQLVEEIKAQRELSQAECRNMQLNLQSVSAEQVLSRTMRQLRSASSARDIELIIDPMAKDVEFRSDPVLVQRVMMNLVKNAVEASEHGDPVTSAYYPDGDAVCFTVHNAAVMSDEVQRQIFMRSFSTKGIGRGLGTYSVRLITEQYLCGTISFVSAPEMGTTFTLRLPLVCAEQ